MSMLLTLILSTGLLPTPEYATQEPKEPPEFLKPDPAWKPLGRSLWFDAKNKRLILRAKVVFREGPLEHLLCLKQTKEHESILSTDAVPKLIHAGLLTTGAEVGHPVRFMPKFIPPAGDPIAIELRWQQDGKEKQADAREWVRDERTKKPLDTDWVFAGSEFFDDPVTKKKLYGADFGDLITVANFSSSLLDLPFASSADDADRVYVANTEKIPPVGTEVFLSLHPRKSKKPGANVKPAAEDAPPAVKDENKDKDQR